MFPAHSAARAARLAFASVGSFIFGFPAFADVADFYRGKTIDMIVASEAGGGYDAYARLIVRYMERHLPGQPKFVVKNMVGAGGIVATNYLANVARNDGTILAQVQNTVPFQPLFAPGPSKFDATRLGYIGSANSEVSVTFAWHTSAAQNFAALRERETLMAGVQGSISSQYARALNEFAGTKIKLIVGYPGATRSLLAVENGEVEGYPAIFWSTLKVTREPWLRENRIRMLVQMALKKHPDLPDVPLALEHISDERDRRTVELMLAPQVGGRPFIAPPGLPADRLEVLRKAFADSLTDKEFMEEAGKRKLEVQFVSGSELADLIAQAYRAPPEIVERVRKIYAGN